MALAGYPFNGYLSDDYLSTADAHGESYFQKLGVNPTAWAIRSARTQAITSATSSVVICQQMVVDWLQNSNIQYQAVVGQLNAQVSLSKESAWNGPIGPFDLLIVLAHALTNMSRNNDPNLITGEKNFQEHSKGVYIVQTTNDNTKNETDNGGWEDQTPIWELKKRLKIIMHIVPTLHGRIASAEVDGVLDKMIHYKRTGNTKDKRGHNLYSHSKIVCVDRKLMYVGSDNAYPSYNEEHGVWFEDKPTIEGWLNGFFVDYWEALEEPDDLNEPPKAK